MLAQSQPNRTARHYQSGGHRHASAGDWRTRTANDGRTGFSGYTSQNAGYQTQTNPDLYRIQQTQMNLQLESMKLQNIEMQERIMAAFHQQQAMQRIQQDFAACSPYDAQQQPQTYVDPRGQQHHHHTAAVPMQHNDLQQQQRLDALASLQMAQSRRSPSPEPREAPRSFASQQQQQQRQPAYTAPEAAAPKSNKKANRLSFNGSSGSHLLEHAMARKTSGEVPASADFMNTSFGEEKNTPANKGHTRGQSSVSSCASGRSLVLSEEHRELFSPQGPTIFLSSPGDSFMPPPRQTSLNSSSSSDEDNSALSSGSDSPTEETPASSQSSLSSLASDHSKATANAPTLRRVSSNGGLNPAAMSFTPKPASPSPPVMPVSVVVTRQPKGPARDEDIEQKNFEGRRRKQALAKLKRRSFAGAA